MRELETKRERDMGEEGVETILGVGRGEREGEKKELESGRGREGRETEMETVCVRERKGWQTE